MDYLETNWVDGQTPLSASNMNKIEQAIKTLASGGSGLTPEQLAKLNGIEDGAQKNPSFKTVNGNEITGTGDIVVEATVSDAVIEQKVVEKLQGLDVATEEWVRNYTLSKNDTYTQAQVHQAILDAQVGGDVAALTDSINRIVEDRLADVELQYRQLDRYYTAQEIGAYKWDEIPQGKGYQFTTEQYRQGYVNNAVITQAIEDAYRGGYLRVILEKGFYPTTGNRQTSELNAEKAEVNKGSFHICPRGVERIAFNLAGGTIFHIWNSNIRQPYDERVLDETNETTARNTNTFNWSGKILSFPDARYVRLENGIIRGDMYYRTYDQDPNEERRVEFGTGVFNSPNARVISLKNMDISGFRGDAVSGSPRGYTLYQQNVMTWTKGGIDGVTGVEVTKDGSYRTPLLNLSSKTIIDNAVQIMTGGTHRIAGFRDTFFDVYFYRADGSLISTEKALQCDDIYLPKDTTDIRFVTNNDERTTETADFQQTWLVTGTSDGFHIEDCTFHYCMRGAVSNVASNFSATRLKIHTIGDAIQKFGDLPYLDPTKYAFNFEDVYVKKFKIFNCDIKDAYKPFIVLARNGEVSDCTFTNCPSSAVIHATERLTIKNNKFNNAGLTIDWTGNQGNQSVPRYALIEGNIVVSTGGSRWEFYANSPHIIDHKDNTVIGCYVNLQGNVFSEGNKYDKINGSNTDTITFNDVAKLDDQILGEVGTAARNIRMFEKRRSRKNRITWISQPTTRSASLNKASDHIESKTLFYTPVDFTCEQQRDLDIISRNRDGFIDKHDFYKSTWHGARFLIGNYGGATRTYNDMQVTYKECEFSFFSLTSHTLDANKESTFTINFEDCVFNFDDLDFLYDVDTRISLGSLILNFKRCIFEASSQKDIRIVKTGVNTQIGTITSKLTDCEFENVVNIDGITTVTE